MGSLSKRFRTTKTSCDDAFSSSTKGLQLVDSEHSVDKNFSSPFTDGILDEIEGVVASSGDLFAIDMSFFVDQTLVVVSPINITFIILLISLIYFIYVYASFAELLRLILHHLGQKVWYAYLMQTSSRMNILNVLSDFCD